MYDRWSCRTDPADKMNPYAALSPLEKKFDNKKFGAVKNIVFLTDQ